MINPAKHIHSEYDKALDKVRSDFNNMFGFTQNMLGGACEAFKKRSASDAELWRMTDKKVDALDTQICENIFQILACWQSVASDLRFIIACLRLVSNLERVGDYTKNICKRIRSITESASSLPPEAEKKILAMFTQAGQMLDLAASAFAHHDKDSCQKILDMDTALDSLHKEIVAFLSDHMRTSPADIQLCMELMLIGKNLERIGDHVTNIAEMIAFSVSAEVYDLRRPIEDGC